MAKIYLFQAENASAKAHQMRIQRVSLEKRKDVYQKACELYFKAYKLNRHLFTMLRIEEAQDACWKAEMADEREIFIQFATEYAQEHPKESEYGDTDGAIMEV